MAHPSPRIFGQNRRTRPRPFARCQSRCVPDDFWRKQGIVSTRVGYGAAVIRVRLGFRSPHSVDPMDWLIQHIYADSANRPIAVDPYESCGVGSVERRLQLDDPMPYLCRDQPGKDGDRVFEATASFIIDHTTDQPISLRINNERAAFEGRLALGSVTLTPQPNRRPEIPHELQIALGQ
jgi:hypothetical protein